MSSACITSEYPLSHQVYSLCRMLVFVILAPVVLCNYTVYTVNGYLIDLSLDKNYLELE